MKEGVFRREFRKIVSGLLAACLLISMLPRYAWATEPEPTEPPESPEPAEPPETEPIGSGTPDGTPPVLNGLTISATEVTIPGEIEVIVEASDDVSGVKTVYVRFFYESTKKYLDCYADKVGTAGKYHATLKLDQYVESGTFVVYRVDLEDKAENYIIYNRTSSDKRLTQGRLRHCGSSICLCKHRV